MKHGRDTPGAHRCQLKPESLDKSRFYLSPDPPKSPLRSRAVSFSCRGNPPVVALMPETPTKSWMRRVGTGALPLQNDDLSENETALP